MQNTNSLGSKKVARRPLTAKSGPLLCSQTHSTKFRQLAAGGRRRAERQRPALARRPVLCLDGGPRTPFGRKSPLQPRLGPPPPGLTPFPTATARRAFTGIGSRGGRRKRAAMAGADRSRMASFFHRPAASTCRHRGWARRLGNRQQGLGRRRAKAGAVESWPR